MPLYEFRLEAQDGSGHLRTGTINAPSEKSAKLILQEREREYVLFRLGSGDPEAEDYVPPFGAGATHIAELEEEYGAAAVQEALALPAAAKIRHVVDDQGRVVFPPHARAKIALHRQTEPYKLVSCKEKVG